jgi:hypothetical protein
MHRGLKFARVAAFCTLAAALVIAMTAPGFARDKYETIEATAWGTSTQMGAHADISLEIYSWSTAADRQILAEAFQKGQNQGLVNALTKMKAVGHISITGTLGYDISYIRMEPTPTGRKISFVTNRLIRFGEAFADTQSQAYNLSGGILNLDDQDKTKSNGMLAPAAQLIINDQGKLQIDLRENPWRVSDIIDWKGTSEN